MSYPHHRYTGYTGRSGHSTYPGYSGYPPIQNPYVQRTTLFDDGNAYNIYWPNNRNWPPAHPLTYQQDGTLGWKGQGDVPGWFVHGQPEHKMFPVPRGVNYDYYPRLSQNWRSRSGYY